MKRRKIRATWSIATLATTFVVLAALPAFGQDESIDPSKPTNLYSYIDFSLEWQGFERGDTYGLRLMPTYSPNAKNMFQAEIPLQYASFEGADSVTGVGDIRIRYFGLPVIREATLTHIGFSVDFFAPTGDDDKGLGSGAWVIAPGLLLGIAASDSLNFYPILSYQYSAKTLNCTAGGSDAGGCIPPGPGQAEDDGTTGGISFEVISVIGLPHSMWLQVIPKYSEVIAGPESRSFNVRLNWGIMLKDNLSLTADVLHELENRDGLQNHLRLGLAYYF